jgi:3-hydroxyisobutyrate dehydrogenase-like beta-hydroxyacid dehydrogenase
MGSATKLGFIGLGQMGAPMAERLLGPDVELHVFDTSSKALAPFARAGAIAHKSPKSVADNATIVFASLPSQNVSQMVALGDGGIAEGDAIKIYVEMSTIGADCIRMIAGDLAKRGIVTIDGPISGGPPAAKAGRLAMMASGEPSAVATVSPWLARIGDKVYDLGEQPGQAQTMKLINNLLMATNLVAASEGLAMGAKAGLKPLQMAEVIEAGSGQSASLNKILVPSALTGAFSFGAHLSIVAKDTALGTAEAEKLSVSLPVIHAAHERWQAALAAGMSSEDFTKIFAFIQEQSGLGSL